MARTAPVPNIPPIPGMCPSIAVMAGGGGGGGGSGNSAGSGDGSASGDGSGAGDAAAEDGRNAPGSEACGDPVDVVTGRVFMDVQDFAFPGPSPLKFTRSYNSRRCEVDGDLGHGWTHDLGWRIELGRSEAKIIDGKGTSRAVPVDVNGAPVEGTRDDLGCVLERRVDHYTLIEGDAETYRDFRAFADPLTLHLVRVRDRNDNTIEIERDAKGLIRAIVDTGKRRLSVSSDARGRILSIQFEGITLIRYLYDEPGDLVAAMDPLNHARRYGYQHHLLVSHELKTGLVYHWRYDGAGREARCLETWGEYPGKVDPALAAPPPPADPSAEPGRDRRKVKGIFHYRFDYDRNGLYTEVTDARGGVTRYEGTRKGLVWKKVDPRGGVTQRKYDAKGALLGESHPNGRAVEWQRGPSGRVHGVVDPGGKIIGFTNDSFGRPVMREEPDGARHIYQRDRNGNIVRVIFPDETSETYEHDERGLVTRFVERTGATWLLTYDQAGNCTSRVHPDGGTTTVQYDAFGRWVLVKDPEGHVTRHEYDLRGDLIATHYPDGAVERNSYDPEGHILSREQPGGRVDRMEYGGHGWLCSHTDPLGRTSTFAYDPLGFVVVTRSAEGATYETDYDVQGNASEMRTFDGRRIRHRYDGGRRRTRTTLPSGKSYNMEYDAWDRQTLFSASDGTEISSVWSEAGDLEESSAGKLHLERDRLGQLATESSASGVVRRTYDAGGRLSTVRTPSGAEIRYEYGAAGRIRRCSVGTCSLDIERDRRGLATAVSFGNRTRMTSIYDPMERLVARTCEDLATPGAAPAVARTVTYDSLDNVARIDDADWGASHYEHDAAWQLKLAADYNPAGKSTRERNYEYTPVGNPVELASNGIALHRYATGGKLLAKGAVTYDYDPDGRLIEKRLADGTRWSFEWNALGQLTCAKTKEKAIHFAYDLYWRRIAKAVRSASGKLLERTTYAWVDDVLVEETSTVRGTRVYVHDPATGEPLLFVDPSAQYLCVTDHIGTVRELVDTSGRVAWRGRLSPYGMLDEVRGKVHQPLRFSGQYADEETGLHYNRARYYDPDSGLYIRPDPIGLQGGLSAYRYTSNPTDDVDPLGLAPRRSRSAQGPDETDGEFASRIGPHAQPNGYVPNYPSEEQSFPKAIRDRVDQLGQDHGCHTCGARPGDPGFQPASAKHNFTPDHQPPVKLRAPGSGDFRLYPQCGTHSSQGGGSIRHQPAGSRSGFQT